MQLIVEKKKDITCCYSCANGTKQSKRIYKMLTLPPVGVRTAKVMRVDGSVLPGTKNCAKAAVWPSSGWLTFRSTE